MHKKQKSQVAQQIRLLFLGDPKTGKSTLIAKCAGLEEGDKLFSSAKSEQSGVLHPILLPVENKLEDFSTILIDTPGNFGDAEADMGTKIKTANAIVLMYDMADEGTVNSLRNYWLPLISKYNSKVTNA
jgi:GTPase SAR1 family protein